MAKKLTPWFPGDVKPVHEGVYQRRFADGVLLFSAFEQGIWFCGEPLPKEASEIRVHSRRQSLPWRGLAQDPAKEAA